MIAGKVSNFKMCKTLSLDCAADHIRHQVAPSPKILPTRLDYIIKLLYLAERLESLYRTKATSNTPYQIKSYFFAVTSTNETA